MRTSNLIQPRSSVPRPSVASARGCYMYDTDGRRYLDGCSSAIVANIGHSVPEVVAAITRQADAVTFAYRTQFTNHPAEELARRLAALAPDDLDEVFFVNSGSEATEAAARLAWEYWRSRNRPEKRWIITRHLSYHGMTLGALSMSGHSGRRRSCEGLLHEFPAVPPAYCYRCPLGLERASCGLACAEEWERSLSRLGAANVAAVVVEPVVGASGGALPAPDGYLTKLRELCDRHEVLLVFDEVMTGLGRTGRWFGGDVEGVTPDMIVLGKGMSAGYTPMAAVIARTPIMQAVAEASDVAQFGHTYSANPLSAATCLAVLDYLEDHDLVSAAHERGTVLRADLERLAFHHEIIGDVRGRGLLLGIELVADRATRRRFPPEVQVADRLVQAAFERGLLVYPAALPEGGDSVLIAPPLTISPTEVDHLLLMLGQALGDVERAVSIAAPEPAGMHLSPLTNCEVNDA
jgi:adenosylmethionine-8-amino-7-oxononanoate aminotransferase